MIMFSIGNIGINTRNRNDCEL